jgi:hypothetical protein
VIDPFRGEKTVELAHPGGDCGRFERRRIRPELRAPLRGQEIAQKRTVAKPAASSSRASFKTELAAMKSPWRSIAAGGR